MNKILIDKLKRTKSVVEFYKFKEEIIKELEGKSKKSKGDGL